MFEQTTLYSWILLLLMISTFWNIISTFWLFVSADYLCRMDEYLGMVASYPLELGWVSWLELGVGTLVLG